MRFRAFRCERVKASCRVEARAPRSPADVACNLKHAVSYFKCLQSICFDLFIKRLTKQGS